jgi:hypothetical protein
MKEYHAELREDFCAFVARCFHQLNSGQKLAELSVRLFSVLEVVYLIFNEGYTAARGEDSLRPQLCNEALRMGRVLTSIALHEPEAHGLLALTELNARARRRVLTQWASQSSCWTRTAHSGTSSRSGAGCRRLGERAN